MSSHSKSSVFDEKPTSANISIEEDEFLEPWQDLLQYMTTAHLETLHRVFQDKSKASANSRLSKEEFVEAIDATLGNSRYSMQAITLFNEIPEPEADRITWSQFIDYYVDHGISRDGNDVKLTDPEVFGAAHVQRQTIVKIVLLETAAWFCYAVISKYGKVGLYSGHFDLLSTYQVIFTRSDSDAKDKYRPRKSVWVTDAVFLPNVQILAICTAARSLSFYEASGQRHMPLWLIEGIPNVAECLDYYHDADTSKLFMGTDDGSVITMTFHKAKEELFRKKHNDKMNKFFWRELADETAHVTVKTYRKVHSSLAHSVKYYSEYQTLVSASRDSKDSVVFFSVKERKKNYVFKMSQGVNCFDVNYDLHILVTGSDSGAVRVWNIFVPAKPIAQLMGHKKGIVDVRILAGRNLALSCCHDAVLKAWNLKNFACEQTFFLNYPSFGVLGKAIEWGTSTIYPGPKPFGEEASGLIDQNKNKPDVWNRPTLIVTCCNYIAKVKLASESSKQTGGNKLLPPPPLQNDIMIPSHWRIGHPSFLDDEDDDPLERPKPNKFIKRTVKELMQMDFLRDQKLHDKNRKLAALEARKSETMRKCVKQCSPFLALDLFDLEEVKLSPNLPVPSFKSTQRLAERTQRLLSAASTRSGILSDLSKSSRSSRSSIIEF